MAQYSLQMPGMVYGGENTLDMIPGIIEKSEKIAVITDEGVKGAGLLSEVTKKIEKVGKEYVVLKSVPSEPGYKQVQELVEEFRGTGADFIIAVGGGSVMDTAKIVSVLSRNDYGVMELFENQSLGEKGVGTLMIPTTAGTGAETTPIAIVTFPEKELKMRIVNPGMMADYCILDPLMIRNLPRKIAASTGVDALCHAIECFTSNKANPFSDLYSLNALDLILNNIIEACDNPDAVQAKINMQTASFYAGVAITAAGGNTAVHALSYPLGGKYHIAHGVSNAMLLLPVMRFNETACREKLSSAYIRCIRNGNMDLSQEEQSAYFIENLEKIIAHLEIPTSLKEFNVPSEDLEILVKGGMEIKSLLSNNMRKVTPDDAREIFRQIM